ncbi:tetratricopeptide repeat protein [Altericroceibacterium spongiae]|nr:tetratricopeptide repeat protein [Altericroceibacterium spongiae]
MAKAGINRRFCLGGSVVVLAAMILPQSAMAQWDITYPDTPPEDGQTLLEWANIPILGHRIPREDRGDITSCNEMRESHLLEAASTCWPLLQPLQLLIRQDFAAEEPTYDSKTQHRKALALGRKIITLIGTPRFPLQRTILMQAYRTQAHVRADAKEWTEAVKAKDKQIQIIEEAGIRKDDFALAFALRQRAEYLLELENYDEARKTLESARPLLSGPNGAATGWPFAEMTEILVKDAIERNDLAYGEDILDSYLDYVRQAPSGMRFGYADALALKLHFVAGRNDKSTAANLLDERFEVLATHLYCTPADRDMIESLGALKSEPDIAERIAALNC